MSDTIEGVLCFWEYVPNAEKFRPSWKLVESFAVNEYGHPLDIDRLKLHVKSNRRYAADSWLLKETDNDDHEPIMGRAVTYWSISSGVMLQGFNPPEWAPKWISSRFYEAIKENLLLLDDGHYFIMATIEAARKVLKDNDGLIWKEKE